MLGGVCDWGAALQLIAELRSAIERASKNIRDLYGAGLALARVPDLRFGAPAHTVWPAAQPGLGDRGALGTGGAYRVLGPDPPTPEPVPEGL